MYPKPDKPLVVVYTLFHDKWSFLYFEVDQNVFINPKACNCKDCKGPTKTCKKAVIETTKGKLKIKRHSADSRAGVNMWDLAVLRKPQHPNANASVTPLPVKYIVLAFATLSDKLEFQETFSAVQKLLNKDEQDYKRAILPK